MVNERRSHFIVVTLDDDYDDGTVKIRCSCGDMDAAWAESEEAAQGLIDDHLGPAMLTMTFGPPSEAGRD